MASAGAADGGGATPPGTQLAFHLSRLEPDDDMEAYLTTFERTAALAWWPPTQWTYILGLYLFGPAQMVWRTLPAADIASYSKLKEALLDQYVITEETFHQCFHAVRYSRPRVLLAKLKEAAMHWLKPTTDEGWTIVDKVVLDQAYHIMPPEAWVWVLLVRGLRRCRGPRGAARPPA